MTITPGFILTAAGAAAVAAAIASPDGSGVVHLASMAFGDANGFAYTPSGAETALRNERARVSLDGVVRDLANPGQVLVTASLPAGVGGFDVREIGVFLADGGLAAIGPAALHKPVPAEGVVADWEVTLALAVSAAATVDVHLDDGAAVTAGYVLAHRQYFAVKSATLTAPPSGAADEDQYLIPSGASDVWAQRAGQVAIWRAGQAAWLYVTPAVGSMVGAADTDASWRLTSAGGWVRLGRFDAEDTLPAGSTVDLGAARSNLVKVTGALPITSLGASADLTSPIYFLRFTGAPRLVNGPNLQLPGAADIAIAPGDEGLAQYLGAGSWRVFGLFPAGGYDRAGAAGAAQAAAAGYTDAALSKLAAVLSQRLQADEDALAALAALVNTKVNRAGDTLGSFNITSNIIGPVAGFQFTLAPFGDNQSGHLSLYGSATGIPGGCFLGNDVHGVSVSRTGVVATALTVSNAFTVNGPSALQAVTATTVSAGSGTFNGIVIDGNIHGAAGAAFTVGGSPDARSGRVVVWDVASPGQGQAVLGNDQHNITVTRGARPTVDGKDILDNGGGQRINGSLGVSGFTNAAGRTNLQRDGTGLHWIAAAAVGYGEPYNLAYGFGADGNQVVSHYWKVNGATVVEIDSDGFQRLNQTPPRTANDTRAANMAAVKAQVGNYASQGVITGSGLMSGAQCGAKQAVVGAGGYTITLPGTLPTNAPLIVGDRVAFISQAGASCTLVAPSGYVLFDPAIAGGNLASVALLPGWQAEFFFDGGVSWKLERLGPAQGAVSDADAFFLGMM